MALTTLNVVSVPVSDQDQAKQFYTEKLGFTLVQDTGPGGPMRWVLVQPPGGGTRLTLVTWFETMPAGSLRGLVISCDDLEKTLDELAGRGVEFNEGEIQQAPWGRFKTLSDPDGNGLIVQQDNPQFRES